MARTKDRIYRLLALIYPWRDIAAAQWTLRQRRLAQPRQRVRVPRQHPRPGSCASASCRCSRSCRVDEKVRRGNVLLKTRPRDVEETLLQLINDEDQVVAAAAIDAARAAQDVGARRRHRARARASRRARLVRLRGGVVGAGREPDAGRTPPRAVARAAAGRGARGAAARAAAVRVGQRRRAVPHRRRRAPGPPRPGQRPARGRRRCPRPSTSCSTAASSRPAATAQPHSIVRSRRARVREALLGHADARDDADRGPRGHAGDDAGASCARCSPTTPISSADCSRRCRRRRRAYQQPSRRRPPARARAARAPAACRRSRRSWRCSACRSSRASRPTRCGSSPTSPQTVDLTPGATPFTESAAPALWLMLSGELSLTSEDADVAPRDRPRAATSSDRST